MGAAKLTRRHLVSLWKNENVKGPDGQTIRRQGERTDVMIKTVIFDIDNTMYSFDRAHQAAMEELLGYGQRVLGLSPEFMQEKLRETQRNIVNRLGVNDSAIHNRLIRFQCFLEAVGNREFGNALEMYHIYWDTILRVMEPEPGVKELISALHSDGIRVGVGTDMTAYIQYKKLIGLDVMKDISFIVTSEEAGAEKPSEKFFRLCVEKAGCLPEECVFIGDSLEKDVCGAEAFGLTGIWYCPGKEKKESDNCSRKVITDFREIILTNRR